MGMARPITASASPGVNPDGDKLAPMSVAAAGELGRHHVRYGITSVECFYVTCWRGKNKVNSLVDVENIRSLSKGDKPVILESHYV